MMALLESGAGICSFASEILALELVALGTLAAAFIATIVSEVRG